MLGNVGAGRAPSVTVPPECVVCDLDVLCDSVLGADVSATGRNIICLTLDDAASINSRVIARMPGAVVVAAAADVKINCKDPELYSDEFLASLHITGAPPAVLELKVGAR
jgi:hypothetical protein